MAIAWEKKNVQIRWDNSVPANSGFDFSNQDNFNGEIRVDSDIFGNANHGEQSSGTVFKAVGANGEYIPTVMISSSSAYAAHDDFIAIESFIKTIVMRAAEIGIMPGLVGAGPDSDDILFFNFSKASSIKNGKNYAGSYIDGDEAGRGQKFIDGFSIILPDHFGKMPLSKSDLLDIYTTIIHEIMHRYKGDHGYQRISAHANLSDLLTKVDAESAASDAIYSDTRNVMVSIVENGLVPELGLSNADGSLQSRLWSDDVAQLYAAMERVEYYRQAVLVQKARSQYNSYNGANAQGEFYDFLTSSSNEGFLQQLIKLGVVSLDHATGKAKIEVSSLEDWIWKTAKPGLAEQAVKALQEGKPPLASYNLSLKSRDINDGVETVSGRYDFDVASEEGGGQEFFVSIDLNTGNVVAFHLNGIDLFSNADPETIREFALFGKNAVLALEGAVDPANGSNFISANGSAGHVKLENEEGKRTLVIKLPDDRLMRNYTNDDDGRTLIIESSLVNGVWSETRRRTYDGLVRITETVDGPTQIRVYNSPLNIDFVNAGEVIGNVLGNYIAKGNQLVSVVSSATLKTIGSNLGDVLNASLFDGGGSTSKNIEKAFDGIGGEFIDNLKGAGVGAVSAYLTAEIINALGIGGFAGELANTAGGAILGQMAANIAEGVDLFTGLEGTQTLSMVGQAVGSFLGAKLAGELVSFDTIGGQLGSAIGSTLGSIALGPIVAKQLSMLGAGLAGPVGAAVGAFIGFIAGGLIGSLFGGTPRSGADIVWDESNQSFSVANIWSKKGGSKEAAQSVASSVATAYNNVIGLVGGILIDPVAVQAGNYGMRGKKFVYRPVSSRDKEDITASFGGKEGANKLITYGIYSGLSDADFRIMGGSTFLKRALYNHLSLPGVTSASFEMAGLMGDFRTAQQFEQYLENSVAIGALIRAEPDSVFAAEWALVIARATELGLHRRHAADWYGGFAFALKQSDASAADVEFGLGFDPVTGIYRRQTIINDVAYDDSIDFNGQDLVEGDASANIINLSGKALQAAGNGANQGLTLNGKAYDGQVKAIDVAAVINAGAGDDEVNASDLGDTVMGGLGNDILYGGRLDDWLFGGDGDDILDAGTSNQNALGGDGNYLNGGAGNDILRGREGSDWLEGGEGVDLLIGGAGGDILAGGAGDGDLLQGGSGGDQYIIRKGDGADIIHDDPGNAGSGALDPISQRLAAIDAGTVKRDWHAEDIFRSDGPPLGGDDSLVLGQGITLNDIRLVRGGAIAGTTAADLILQLMTTDTNGARVASGDQVIMQDWFNSLKRVEWLVLADGQAIRIGDFTSFIVGTNENDVLIGTHGNDFVVGGDGDDLLDLLPGYDVGIGGKGRDFIAGDAHDDLIAGGDDDDRLLGGTGNDVVSGDAGNDDIYGGAGRDILSGGRGDDLIAGGLGDDVFRFRRGDGRDTIIDEHAGVWETILHAGSYTAGYSFDPATNRILKGNEVIFDGVSWLYRMDYDYATDQLKRLIPDAGGAVSQDATIGGETGDSLEFDIGINIQDISFLRSGFDLVLGIGTGNSEVFRFSDYSDQITLKDWYRSTNRPIENFVFASTGKLNMEVTQITGGTDGDDTLAGSSNVDWITGGAGNDTLSGATGNDILNGNSGSDVLDGGDGDDVLYGGAGNDILHGGKGADILIGGDGEDTASYAASGSGLRVYLGHGHVSTIDAFNDTFTSIENLTGSQNGDRLGGNAGDNFMWGGAGWDNLLGNAGDDTYYFEVGETGSVTIIEGAFSVEEAVGRDGQLKEGYQISKWERTNVSWAEGRYYWRLQVTGPDGEPVYDYDKYTVVEENGTQPPTPSGYIVNEGNTPVGWLGGFKRTYNQQVTREKFDEVADGGYDVIEFGEGVSLSNISIQWSENNLQLYYGPAQRLITINGQRTGALPINALQFADGLVAETSSLFRVWNTSINGTNDADLIIGGSSKETLHGLGGDDVLSGGTDNDKLYGGEGDDVLEGGAGADILDGGSGADTIRYVLSDVGIHIDLVAATASGGHADGDTLVSIENVVGSASHADTLLGDAGGNILSGLGGDDYIDGRAGDDVLIGGAGNDTLIGGVGDDNIAGEEGNDIAYGGDGKDLIDGGSGDDQLYGDAGDDQLIGGTGADLLDGGDGNDILLGGVGDDTLHGGAGDDQLTGDIGNDHLYGGLGDDTYLFNPSSGQDVVSDASGQNKIAVDGVSSLDQIWMVRSGDDLIVSIIGSSASVRFEDYFQSENPTRMHSIVTQTHALYLGYAQPLIDAMTQHQVGTPAQMPDAIKSLLNIYWHEQGKARPTATPLVVEIDEDQVTSGFLTNIVDHDENIVSYEIVTNPNHGAVTINAEIGEFVYTPDANYYGLDSFMVRAVDADGHVVDAMVNFTIRSVNDRPHDISLTAAEVDENTPGMVIGDLLAADVDDPETDYGQHIFTTTDARFEIVGNRTLKLRDGVSLDFEAEPVVSVSVNAIDQNGAGLVFTKVLEINVRDLIDIIQGTESPETLTGAQGIDYIYGHGGNDTIFGRAGDDRLDGGAGNDTLHGEEGDDLLYGNVGDDHLYGGIGADVLHGGEGNDRLFGGGGADELNGDAGQDELFGGAGNDILRGGDGDDKLIGGEGVDHFNGGDGVDEVDYYWTDEAVQAVQGVGVDLENSSLNTGDAAGETHTDIENISGTSFADILRGNAADNLLQGHAGDDVLDGRAGNDTLLGGDGFDTLSGGEGSDHLDGGTGNDTLLGGAGNDTLLGGDGNDNLQAGDGDDLLDGGAGNDWLDGGLGNDTYLINRSSGSDTIYNYDPSGDDIDVIGYQDTHGAIADRDLWFTRDGDDLLVSIIGTSTVTRIVNWYQIADANSRANYKIDFFIAGERFTKTIDAEGLVDLFEDYEQPVDLNARDALDDDPDFNRDWNNLWGNNLPPEIEPITNQTVNEDGTLTLTIRATDDITPYAGLQVTAIAVDSLDGVTPDDSLVEVISVGPVDANGYRTLTLQTKPNRHGLAAIRLTAVDAGSVASEALVFHVQVNAVADAGTITQAADVHATSGVPIALHIEADFADLDGSEEHTIFISGVPSGISLSAGVYDSETGLWQLTPEQLPNLKLHSQPGDSRDFSLSVFARSKETSNNHTVDSTTRQFTVRLNAPPTGVANWNGRVAENAGNGTVVGTVQGADPDGDTLTYQLTDSADGRFQINYQTGVVTVLNGDSTLNYEAMSSHNITVRITDSLGAYKDVVLAIGVDDVNEPNIIQPSFVFTPYENREVELIGQVWATDVDQSAPFNTQKYYFWVNNQYDSISIDGYFRIDENTGQIYTTHNLNYETRQQSSAFSQGALKYTVVARDNAGNQSFHQASTVVTINIQNDNDAPVLSHNQTFYIDENVGSNGQQIITFDWNDEDGKGNHRFEIVSGDPNGMWRAINSGRDTVTGEIVGGGLALNGTLDFETTSTYTLGIKVTDSANASHVQTVTINVINANDPPRPTVVETDMDPQSATWRIRPNDQDHSSGFIYHVKVLGGTWQQLTNYNGASEAFFTYRPNVDPGRQEQFTVYFRVTDPGGISGETVDTVWIAGRDLRPGEEYHPVVFDLDGDGLELVEFDMSGLTFDMDGDGIRDMTGWVGADDGFLVLDRNGNGFIDDGSEISYITDVVGAQTDLEGLRAFDTNGNGLLDQGDANFASFQIWRDVNQDGVSQQSELRSLADYGVTVINLLRRPTGQDSTGENRNVISALSDYFFADGAIGTIGDVSLFYQPGETRVAPPIILDLDGNGLNLVPLAASPVLFDMDGDGIKDRTGWAGPGDAFLVLDSNANGIVDDISEISFVQYLEGAKTDLEGLKAFDSNGDGFFSSEDELFHVFKVWTDGNQNGLTDEGELKLLSDVSIASIDLAGKATGAGQQPGQNILYNTTTFTRENGSTGTVGDVGLAYTKAGTGQTEVLNAGEDDGQIRAPRLLEFDQKAKKYLIETSNGQISVRLRKTKGVLSPLAGSVGGYVELNLADKVIGYASTVVLDLDGDGLEMKRRKKSKAALDMNGDGSRDDTGWIGKGDAFLALDRNGDGRINGLSEISFLGDKAGARSSLDGLSAYDSNRDGKLDKDDARFGEFLVWSDRNGNGVSDDGELASLADSGIESIQLNSQAYDARWKPGYNVVSSLGTFTRTNGHVSSLGDVALSYEPTPTEDEKGVKSLLAALTAPDERSLEVLRAATGGEGALGAAEIQHNVSPDSLSDKGRAFALDDHSLEARLTRMVQAMALFGGDGASDLERYRPMTPSIEPMRFAAPHQF